MSGSTIRKVVAQPPHIFFGDRNLFILSGIFFAVGAGLNYFVGTWTIGAGIALAVIWHGINMYLRYRNRFVGICWSRTLQGKKTKNVKKGSHREFRA